jgi:hypothetical protein
MVSRRFDGYQQEINESLCELLSAKVHEHAEPDQLSRHTRTDSAGIQWERDEV